jgi:hypothetical protein
MSNCTYIYIITIQTLVRGLTIKFAKSSRCACHGSSRQKPLYGLKTLAYQRFTDVLLLIYGSLFLSGSSSSSILYICRYAMKRHPHPHFKSFLEAYFFYGSKALCWALTAFSVP